MGPGDWTEDDGYALHLHTTHTCGPVLFYTLPHGTVITLIHTDHLPTHRLIACTYVRFYLPFCATYTLYLHLPHTHYHILRDSPRLLRSGSVLPHTLACLYHLRGFAPRLPPRSVLVFCFSPATYRSRDRRHTTTVHRSIPLPAPAAVAGFYGPPVITLLRRLPLPLCPLLLCSTLPACTALRTTCYSYHHTPVPACLPLPTAPYPAHLLQFTCGMSCYRTGITAARLLVHRACTADKLPHLHRLPPHPTTPVDAYLPHRDYALRGACYRGGTVHRDFTPAGVGDMPAAPHPLHAHHTTTTACHTTTLPHYRSTTVVLPVACVVDGLITRSLVIHLLVDDFLLVGYVTTTTFCCRKKLRTVPLPTCHYPWLLPLPTVPGWHYLVDDSPV